MKAWMLLLTVMTLLWAFTAQAEKIDFNSMISETTTSTEKTNQELIKGLEKSSTIGFYNTEWLRLRQRKRYAVAKFDVKLRRSTYAERTTKTQ